MKTFKEFLLESEDHYSDESESYSENGLTDKGVPDRLHDFLFHLSHPSDPTGKEKTVLMEVSLNVSNKKSSVTSEISSEKFPTTHRIITQTRNELPDGNIHKRLGEGFKVAFAKMENETPEESRDGFRAAKKVYTEYAKSRGYKAAPKLLKGNMKTRKSSGEGVNTTGLSLAPHGLSGLDNFDVCPKASSECRAGCLGVTAGGNKQYPDSALSSKVFRTHFIAQHPEHAARLIDREIANHVKKSKKMGMVPGVRLNITSDISWEHHAPQLFSRHPEAQFYDYTKMPNRVLKQYEHRANGEHFNTKGHPVNYHLTLSHTGAGHSESNDQHITKVLEKGGVVASVFQRGKGNKLPTHVEDAASGKRYPVVNGDDDDNTFDRHATAGLKEGHPGHGVVSGLVLKGIKNEAAGHFANKVDEDGIMRINKPKVE